MFWDILLWILIRLLILGGILGLIWLLVPTIFRFIVAPNFDGSYEPKKDTIQIPMQLPPQNLVPELKIVKNQGTYSIHFGDGRALTNGKVKIHWKNQWYSSSPSVKELKLEFIEEQQAPSQGPLGRSKNIAWTWQISGTSHRFQTVFHLFEAQPFLLFETNVIGGLDNLTIGIFDQANVVFPCFDNESYNQRIFTYRNGIFCPPMRDFTFATAPVCLFDDDANTIMISALNQFFTNGIHKLPSESNTAASFTLACGIDGEVDILPVGYSGSFMILFGKGINHTFKQWGDLLHQYYGQSRKDRYMDAMTSYLGYFTDNGAHYYYNPLKGKKYDETLIAVEQHAQELGLPFQYYHLDSWWYLKDVQKWKRTVLGDFGRILGGGLYGGTILWEIDPEALDMTLPELSAKLNHKPLTAHNRWYGLKTPYRERFNFIVEGVRSMPDDPKFWEHIMSFCKDNKIAVYEQDWMRNQMDAFKFLRAEIGAADRWLSDMANAAAKNSVSIQYCMATPAMWMSAVKFPAVSNVRACGDYGPRWPHTYDIPYFMQASMLAWAVGVWPFKDTFQSVRRGRINGERQPELMGLVSALSAGPVAPGDEIGWISKEICMAAARKDGLLYKPDRPMTAADITYVKNSTYYICSTESKHQNFLWYYILTSNLWTHRVKSSDYTLKALGIEGSFVEYDWFSTQTRVLDSNSPIQLNLKYEQYQYLIYAPILPNGMAILGDPTKYVMMSDREFTLQTCSSNKVELKIMNVQDGKSEILIYTPEKINNILLDAVAIPEIVITKEQQLSNNVPAGYNYDLNSQILHIWINFDADGEKMLIINN
jgi:hypothetical protein